MILRLALNNFEREIEDLKKYIQTNIIDYQERLSNFYQVDLTDEKAVEIQHFFQKQYRETRAISKIVNYSAIIILLYAYFEKFLESIAKEYVETLCNFCQSYDCLPKKIRQNHFEKSIELINNIKLDKYRDLITQKKVLENLYHCQCENKNLINFYAYTQHRGNFRASAIRDFFAEIGIDQIHEKIVDLDDFITYIKKKKPELENLIAYKKNVDTNPFYATINDLVRRRNEIAHGAPSNDILSFEIIVDDYIDFIENYSKSLQKILRREIISYEIGHCVNLGKPIQVWNNEIIGIRVCNIRISVGDPIIIKKSNGSYEDGKIVSIQVNRQSKNFIEIENNSIEIALKVNVNFNLKKNQEIFIPQY